MNWFRRAAVIEAEPETDADRDHLAETERDYRIAERDYLDACQLVLRYVTTHRIPPQFYLHNNAVFIPVNANQRADRELQRLERIKQQALAARNELLRKRSELMKKMGLVR